ncbi:hypothetical protein Taro_014394 [Colocasia esculenta]|uniref:Uncharacterized protein n=1 Tax=Colocasia esculenta TaxID=4460 RepID=A0A843UIY0_COLES|nr:hypothetical protein [Colocasia esculenta]
MVLPPPLPVDYSVFMQGLVQAMQTQAALQAQLQAQAQASAPVPQEQGHGGSSIMERFKRMALPYFKGESQPLLEESWMTEVKKILRAIRCAEEDKVSLATYMLQSKCVDTQANCVDTTGNCCRTGFWDSELVSTQRWTVSTPLADCVDTTGYCFRTDFWDSDQVSTHRNPSSTAALQLDLLTFLAEQTSLHRFPLIPMSFLLKGWHAASGDEARSGKPPFAAKKLLLELYGLSCLWGRLCRHHRQLLQNRLLGKRTSVDTQVDCVDTTGRLCRHTGRLCRHHWLLLQNRLLGHSSGVDTQVDCVDTTVTKVQEIDGKFVAAKILSWRQHRVSLTHLDGKDLAAKFFCETGVPVLEEDILRSDPKYEE